jgi:EAL domain-containing protein (putative c-di-GMP-specific phosphodiesterase class I)
MERGDHVLISLGTELGALAKGRGCCSRVFSDKYILFIKYSEETDIKSAINNFFEDFTKKIRSENNNCAISISAGIYIIENAAQTEESDLPKFVDRANIARKNAKAAQNAQENSCVIFKEEMKAELNRSMHITSEAERAMQNREFVVYYQPKISLKEGAVVGAEALVRWRKPDGTLIPPGAFLPYLEKSSFITKVDFYVYEIVCHRINEELRRGHTVLPVSVNVSRLHLRDSGFVEKVISMVEQYRVPPELLEFELTENALLDNEAKAISIMTRLRDFGFVVSIDDFGSGYSSLGLLKNLPVDILKLDRAFFGESDLKANNAIVVSSIIDMATRMNISVVCEGVETQEQVDFLRKNTQCDSVQGFYYARPVPPEDFDDFRERFELSRQGMAQSI